MAGRPPKVDHLKEDFHKSIDSALSLVDAVKLVEGVNPSSSCPRLHTKHTKRVVELAFLGVVASWEDFIEQTFVRYLSGAASSSGYSPRYRIGKSKDIGHSYHVVSGDPDFDPTRSYAKFGDPKWVISISKIYFEAGHPYSNALQTRLDRLQDALKLRNRIAHSSDKCRADFKKVALHHLNIASGWSLTQGFRVGDLLTRPAARHFGDQARDRGRSFFKAYMEMFRDASRVIVP